MHRQDPLVSHQITVRPPPIIWRVQEVAPCFHLPYPPQLLRTADPPALEPVSPHLECSPTIILRPSLLLVALGSMVAGVVQGSGLPIRQLPAVVEERVLLGITVYR